MRAVVVVADRTLGKLAVWVVVEQVQVVMLLRQMALLTQVAAVVVLVPPEPEAGAAPAS